jgi:hypothetical protein
MAWLVVPSKRSKKYDVCFETNASEIEKHAELIARSAIIKIYTQRLKDSKTQRLKDSNMKIKLAL